MTTARTQEERKKWIVIGVFSVLLLFVAYRVYDGFFGGTTSTPPPPVIVEAPHTPGGGRGVTAPPGNLAAGAAAEKLGSTSGQLDPTLHEEAMLVTESLVYTGSGRNIFAAAGQQAPAPVQIAQRPLAPARPQPAVYVPPPPPPTCPPTCPPINLKFFGTSTSSAGVRKAFLLQGDNVFLASTGDVVDRKYRVVSISANSIVVEDMPNTNSQTLPLVLN